MPYWCDAGRIDFGYSVVAEASRDAAIMLLKQFKPARVVDFRRELEAVLEAEFRDAMQKKGHLPGATNKIHTFDYVVRTNDNILLALDAVVPDASSINAAVVAHMDIGATKRTDLRQLIVYDGDQDWKASDLALLTLGAPSVAFSHFSGALERLVA